MEDNWQTKFEALLPQVQHPIRYTNAELHSLKPTGDTKAKIALVFPDTYEIGMSNYGLRILYHIVNSIPEACAERAFIPWVDMLEKMKEAKIPLHSLESRTPLSHFDMVGISLESELCYTNALAVMELAYIPLRSANRTSEHPLIIGGGPCAVNPLPLSPFFDAFVIGDGEDVIREMTNILLETADRDRRIEAFAELEGLWIPRIHGKKKVIRKRTVSELRRKDTPINHIVPIGQTEHDRLVVEIGRGCLQGCRFCQASFCNRPTRYRSVEEILELVQEGLKATGWDEISLLSFAVSDYPNLPLLLDSLNTCLAPSKTAISLPSFRGEAFNTHIGQKLRKIKKTGLTFAPETASPRLKRVINKPISNEEIAETVTTAARLGWRRVKLYFMVGLPGETPEDVDMNIDFIRSLARVSKGITITAHTASFIPKPHTPFQWAEFEQLSVLQEKLARMREEASVRRVKVKWASPKTSFVEAIFARGDEQLAPVLEEVLQRGGYFQEWSEHFSFQRWLDVFKEKNIDTDIYTKARDISEPLPWGFIDNGPSMDFLKEEYLLAKKAQVRTNCMDGTCYSCGVKCSSLPAKSNNSQSDTDEFDRAEQHLSSDGREQRYRLRLELGEEFRYASHLDMVRAVYRTLRRSGLPIAYTEGFSPHPKVRFSFPKPVGVASKGEYVDISLFSKPDANLADLLNPYMPKGLKVLVARALLPNSSAITKTAEILHYKITPSPQESEEKLGIRAANALNIHHLAVSNGTLDLMVSNAQRVKLWEVLSSLYAITPQDARNLQVDRIDVYLRKGGRLLNPLEEHYR